MLGSAVFRTGVAPGGALAGPWVKNELWNKARSVPSLDLRFADNKSLVDATTGQNLVTFTRASSGTYVDSQGVIRTATTNLLLRSEEFNDAYWSRTGAGLTVDAINSPTGVQSADFLVPGLAVSEQRLRRDVSGVSSNTAYTLSVFAKAGGYNYIAINHGNYLVADHITYFDLQAGAVATSAAGSTPQITDLGNGWYRCSVTRTTNASQTTISVRYHAVESDNVPSFAGNGTSGIYLWGAQLEQSTTVGEYIPTTSTINSAPRFDHNPTTGESLGLLVEESRTNLLLQSNGFDTTWFNSNSSETASAGIAPDGTNTAWEFKDTLDTVATTHSLSQAYGGFISGTSYSFSVWVKSGTLDYVALLFPSAAFTTGLASRFSLTTGAATGVSAGVTATSVLFNNGWYRCTITATATSTASGTVLIRTSQANSTSYIGDGTGTVLIWGVQLEAGSFPTSYIPTTTAAVTRSADVASITGSNFGTTRTNLLVRSEEFDNASWLKTAVSVNADVEIAPNGTLTADKLIEDTATSTHQLAANLSFNYVSGTTYTLSCYIKAASRSRLQLAWRSDWFPPDSSATADLLAGTISSGANATGTITAVGNGWYRISVTSTADATGSSASDLYLSLVNDAGSSNYTGDGTSGVFIWGAQLEVGAAVTPYIQSPSVFVSRASSGTYIGGNGVLQTATTNLLLRSEEFDTASWLPTATHAGVTANDAVAPTGQTTADLFSCLTTDDVVRRLISTPAITVSNATVYTASIYVKAKNWTFVGIALNANTTNFNNSAGSCLFNLSTGEIRRQINLTNSSAIDVGNGWWRVSITATTVTTTATLVITLQDADEPLANTAVGVVGNGVYVFGAQLEQSSTVGEYIPTTSTINSAARYDHDPISLIGKGLLLEESRTNLVRNNTMVGAVAGSPGTPPTNGWVITNNATYTSSIIGTGIENGINYIDVQYVIAAGAAASGGIVYADTPAATASTIYTGSYYLKLVSGNSPQVRFVWQDGATTINRTFFSLTTVLTRYADTVTTSVGATLARFAISFAASPSGATFVIRIGLPQVEQGAFATSVIPTTTATVTRAADVSTSVATSVFESSWYRQDEGTLYSDHMWMTTLDFGTVWGLDDGTANNETRLIGWNTGTDRAPVMATNGVAQINYANSSYTAGLTYRYAIALKQNDVAVSRNGVTPLTDNIVTLPLVTSFRIGITRNSAFELNGTIRRFIYWPQRLPDSTLQGITQ